MRGLRECCLSLAQRLCAQSPPVSTLSLLAEAAPEPPPLHDLRPMPPRAVDREVRALSPPRAVPATKSESLAQRLTRALSPVRVMYTQLADS